MNKYRSTALALACCAASVSVAACTAGITTATTAPTTSAPAPTRSASVAAAASTRASSGRMITISGSPGTFPVPAAAKVAESASVDQQIIVVFGSVTPANVSSFYTTALPRAGYVITSNALSTESGVTVAFITFSGHGYKGNVDALSKAPDTGGTLPGYPTKNVTTITLGRK